MNQAQTPESGQDALVKDKYPGLHDCIIHVSETDIEGAKIKHNTFRRISYLLTGDSSTNRTLEADRVEHRGPLPEEGEHLFVKVGKNSLFIPASQVDYHFRLDIDYAEERAPPREPPVYKMREIS